MSMITWKDLYLFVAASAVVLFASIVLIVPIVPSSWKAATDLMPPWVQAVGSILAIVAGVFVVWWQDHNRRQHLLEQEVHRLQLLVALTFFCRVALQEVIRRAGPDRTVGQNLGELNKRVRDIEVIPIFEWPDSAVVWPLSMLPTRCERFNTKVAHILGNEDPHENRQEWIESQLAQAAAPLVGVLSELEATAKSCLCNRRALVPDVRVKLDDREYCSVDFA